MQSQRRSLALLALMTFAAVARAQAPASQFAWGTAGSAAAVRAPSWGALKARWR